MYVEENRRWVPLIRQMLANFSGAEYLGPVQMPNFSWAEPNTLN